jgi:hypothetical protein
MTEFRETDFAEIATALSFLAENVGTRQSIRSRNRSRLRPMTWICAPAASTPSAMTPSARLVAPVVTVQLRQLR